MAKQAYIYDGTQWVPVGSQAATATSANTVNTLVQRDGSGNFSAGTISAVGAALSGNLIVSGTQSAIGTSAGYSGNTLTLGAIGTSGSQEGGQLGLTRASDNALAWYVDVFTPSTAAPTVTQMRLVDAVNSATRVTLDTTGKVTIPGTLDAGSYITNLSQVPYAIATGFFNLSATTLASGSATSATITLPSGRFSQIPIVQVAKNNVPGGSQWAVLSVGSIATNSCIVYAYNASSAAVTWSSLQISVLAAQYGTSAYSASTTLV